MRFAHRSLFFALAALVVMPGCDGCNNYGYTGFDGGPQIDGGPYGSPCSASMPCRMGLACTGGDGGAMTCTGAGVALLGASCTIASDCAAGLWCGPTRRCTTAGTAGDGDACASTASCMQGLVCTVEGLAAHCRPGGVGDIGTTCMVERDCVPGLACVATPGVMGSHCVTPPAVTPLPDGGVPPTFPFVPPWSGETCTDETASPPVSYFRVPRMGHAAGDFYRLPYPNDVRRTATGITLAGHPAPPTAVGTDIVDAYLRASEQDLRGFSTNPTILFRFSRPYDWGTIDVQLIDVTVGAPSFGAGLGRGWITTSGRIGRYICPDWMGVHPGHGAPLLPGHTYAAILLSGVNDAPAALPDGGVPAHTPFAPDPDFTAMLGATAPTDVDLAAAWTAYAPLRMYLASTAGMTTTPLNAAVFTTQDPEAVMRASADLVAARTPPTAMDLVSGDAMMPSPCDDGTPQRTFSAHDARFVEIHGHLALPIFQQGAAPYETTGGGFMLDATGAPIVQRTENVCFAMTVPRTAMPAAGYPVVIFGHGTGGSFTDAIRNGIAGDLASGDLGSPPTALVAIDLPEHGARRGTSTRAPQELFFNFANPRAARDNVAQGAVDLLSVLRYVSTADIAAATSPTTTEIKFDPANIGLFTHSQGSTHAGLALPYMTGVRVAVLSGEGGDLGQSLLTKHSPIDVARVLPLALLDYEADGSLAGGEWHPILGIFQQYFDSVDPVNYAYRLHLSPVAPDRVTNVFMTYGIGDTYSTEATMQAFANAGDLPRVQPIITAFGGMEVPAPLMGNYTPVAAGEAKTQGLRQYMPTAGMDGHFVAFDVPAARADVLRFLRAALSATVPAIGM